MSSLYGYFRNKKFSDVFPDVDTFISAYKISGINILSNVIDPNGNYFTDTNLKAIYYLLYSRYGNNVIASSDLTRFKEQLFSIIIQNTPAWIKKSEIQSKLRSLSEDDIESSFSTISNVAANPNDVTDNNDGELPYINQQNTSKNKKGKISAYTDYLLILTNDYTELYLVKFKVLFITIIEPEELLLYESEE